MKRVTDSHTDAESSTARPAPAVDRAALERLTPLRRLPGRNMSKADVVVYRTATRMLAVKDYAPRPWIARQTVGRWLVRRECRAYAAAGNLHGLARFAGRVDAFALATEWIQATPLAEIPPARVGPATFDRLDAIVAGLHARGVAVADLHHRDVLVGDDGEVHVVDLAAAHVLSPQAGGWRRRLHARLCAQDRLAAARMRARFLGGDEAAALAALDPGTVRLWSAGRRIKAFWDALRGRRA